MKPIEIRRRTPLSPAETWRRVTTWERHGDAIPLTRISRLPGPEGGVGSGFVARTHVGPVGFDDVMEVVAWRPPPSDGGEGFCRIEKRGRLIAGWAEISVMPSGSGSTLIWREVAEVNRIGRVGNAPARVTSRLLFGRLVDTLLGTPG